MNKKNFLNLILLFLIGNVCLTSALGQNDKIEKDIRHLLEMDGSTEQFEMVSQQLIAQFKMQNSSVADSVWISVKEDVKQPAFKKLTEKMIPLYKKNFTPKDIKALIAFYESETGNILVKTQPKGLMRNKLYRINEVILFFVKA